MFTKKELDLTKDYSKRKMEDIVEKNKDKEISDSDLLDLCTLNLIHDGAEKKTPLR